MTITKALRTSLLAHIAPTAASLITVVGLAAGLTGCRPGEEPGVHIADTAVIDARQRHPIVVSKQPANLTVRVAAGSHGLTPAQRAQLVDFLNRYRGMDKGAGRLAVSVPSGGANEVSAIRAMADLRALVRDYGIDDASMSISSYHAAREAQPAIRVSYARFVAEAPECGHWPENIASDRRNLPYPNFGCATQRNLAMQIANPGDLLGPRTMTPSAGERRDVVWEKYQKGEETGSKFPKDERFRLERLQ